MEKLGAFVIVEVGAPIRPANDHHDEVAIDDALVADRRLERIAVLVDPGTDVDCRGQGGSGVDHRCDLTG